MKKKEKIINLEANIRQLEKHISILIFEPDSFEASKIKLHHESMRRFESSFWSGGAFRQKELNEAIRKNIPEVAKAHLTFNPKENYFSAGGRRAGKSWYKLFMDKMKGK